MLKVTNSGQKNELLFKEFGINYNNEPEIAKKGSIIIKKYVKEEEFKEDLIGESDMAGNIFSYN